jgi:hypothetical protein
VRCYYNLDHLCWLYDLYLSTCTLLTAAIITPYTTHFIYRHQQAKQQADTAAALHKRIVAGAAEATSHCAAAAGAATAKRAAAAAATAAAAECESFASESNDAYNTLKDVLASAEAAENAAKEADMKAQGTNTILYTNTLYNSQCIHGITSATLWHALTVR